MGAAQANQFRGDRSETMLTQDLMEELDPSESEEMSHFHEIINLSKLQKCSQPITDQ